jgi:hypothetical protein
MTACESEEYSLLLSLFEDEINNEKFDNYSNSNYNNNNKLKNNKRKLVLLLSQLLQRLRTDILNIQVFIATCCSIFHLP